ncbi:MAG: hypothetical protein B6245_21340 [Desulfobacteraceae bacterium 4572_88]|nr:MAG: hypothetical protein B6245_21340 [Desulfobacteraceae bacterium 4572_88]
MMMSKKPYRSDMISFFPNPLPHFTIETSDIISFPGFLTRRTMAVPGRNPVIRFPSICKNNSILSVNGRHGPPQSRAGLLSFPYLQDLSRIPGCLSLSETVSRR